MDHIDRQRELLKVSGFVIPGNVYKMHYSIMGFGHPEKPNHFSANVTGQLKNIQAVTVIPISTQLFNNKKFITLNLSKDSNLIPIDNEILDRISYALLGLPKQVEVGKLFEEPLTHLRGSLNEQKKEELVKARKKFIKSQFYKSGGK